ncbi:MAG: hypothetical protein JF606_00780 [Burkholderiales bacterium]|nr:hypothetical protein [Burkholderiales bacterium]
MVEHASLLVGVGLTEQLTSHLTERRRLIRTEHRGQSLREQVWRRVLRDLLKMIGCTGGCAAADELRQQATEIESHDVLL